MYRARGILTKKSRGIPFASGQDLFFFFTQQARLQVLKTFQDNKLSGHLKLDCIKYVNSCTACQRNRGSNTKSWGLLRPLSVVEQPWQKIPIDFIVELAPLKEFKTILVVIELSKMAHFLPMLGTPFVMDTANIFIKEIVRLHSLPDSIVFDRGVQFTSREISAGS